eukprot:TRINITY_DN105845_c0_g1_i1.p1 TRINITY_DN105845_c0_g1~~TRINITY_DN105845_c0_g1_i1.p1  ORF type:complete len:442 (-),score=6.40 TRINITY_DN105845_c0_g1_i1:126-1451(-)
MRSITQHQQSQHIHKYEMTMEKIKQLNCQRLIIIINYCEGQYESIDSLFPRQYDHVVLVSRRKIIILIFLLPSQYRETTEGFCSFYSIPQQYQSLQIAQSYSHYKRLNKSMSVVKKGKFYEDYTLPQQLSRDLLNKLRKELLRYTLNEESDHQAYDSNPGSLSVTIQIVSPVLRSSTPRQIVKRMNDVMKYSRNTGVRRVEKRGKNSTKNPYDSQELVESFYCLTKVGIAQKKLERNAKITGLNLPSQDDRKSPLPRASPEERTRFFTKDRKESVKEKRRKAVAYVRAIALELKAVFRNSQAVHTTLRPHGTMSPVVLSARETHKEEYGFYSYTEQSGSASSSSTNSPEMEIRQRPQLSIPKIKLISAAGEYKEENEEKKTTDGPLGKLLTSRPRRNEKQRRYTAQNEGEKEVKATSTFLMNMERLAYDHVISCGKSKNAE